MKRLLTTVLAVAVALLSAWADHTLDSLNIRVTLHRDGSAHVTEHRHMHIGNDGTECYIKMYNMGDMAVSDLRVSEDMTEYVVDDEWEVNRSRTQKAFHCGINEVPEGKELCWGIGESGI